jgi:transitional endoplasmic reticulum ATPase
MTTLRLQVEKAYPNDSGRGIARIDEDTFSRLRASPGDCIKIKENDTTTAKIWRADRQDWDQNMIRLDGFIRQNADVDLGESVEIRNTEVTEADSITLKSPEEAGVQFTSDAASMIKPQIHNRPVLERDMIPIISTRSHPIIRSPGQAIPLIAVTTDPEGVVRITSETRVTIQENDESGN